MRYLAILLALAWLVGCSQKPDSETWLENRTGAFHRWPTPTYAWLQNIGTYNCVHPGIAGSYYCGESANCIIVRDPDGLIGSVDGGCDISNCGYVLTEQTPFATCAKARGKGKKIVLQATSL